MFFLRIKSLFTPALPLFYPFLPVVIPLPFPPVVMQYFFLSCTFPSPHLGLCKVQSQRQVQAFADRQVSGCLELVFQSHQLFVGKGSSGTSRFSACTLGVRAATAATAATFVRLGLACRGAPLIAGVLKKKKHEDQRRGMELTDGYKKRFLNYTEHRVMVYFV